MRILIDMQPLQSSVSGARGVGRYTREVVKRLIKDTTINYVLAFNGSLGSISSDYFDAFPESTPNVTFFNWFPPEIDSRGNLKNMRHMHISELLREYAFLRYEPDVIWCPNLQEGFTEPAVTSVKLLQEGFPVHWVTTLHDVTPLKFPELCLDKNISPWYFSKINYAMKSDLIITDSRDTAESMVELEIGVAEKIVVSELGVTASEWDSTNAESPSLDFKYFIYFGGVELYKNVDVLVEALATFHKLSFEGHRLVFVGREPYRARRRLLNLAKHYGVSEHLLFVPNGEHETLTRYLRGAAAFIYPSLSEGFGLPAIEAIAAGCPVLTSDKGSIASHSVVDEAKFNSNDAQDIARALNWVCLPGVREQLITKQTEYIQPLTWDECASRISNYLRVPGGSSQVRSVEKLDEIFKQEISKLQLEDYELRQVGLSLLRSGYSPSGKKIIFYDVSALVVTDSKSGIQGVVKELYSSMLSNGGFELVAVWADTSTLTYRLATAKISESGEVLFSKSRQVVAIRKNDIYLCCDLHPVAFAAMSGTLSRLMSLGVRAYVYVYDVIPITNPEWFEIDLASTFNEYIKSIATIKCGIIVSTHHVQMRIKNAFRDLENEIFVIGLAARETLTSNVAESTSKKDPRNEVSRNSKIKAIMVGTIEPRKGHMDVLRIFQDKRVSEKIELNVVGGPGWKAEAIEVALKESSHTGAINFLGRISDKELSLLYANSDVLIAASYDEGFGLPLVEAAGLGLAVVARDIPVFREVSDSNTQFLDLSNVESARDYLLSENFEKLITTVKIAVEASEARRRWSNVVEDLFNKFEK